jgi:hypothetical protein
MLEGNCKGQQQRLRTMAVSLTLPNPVLTACLHVQGIMLA